MNPASFFPKALSPFVANGGKVYGAWTKEKEVVAAALLVPSPAAPTEICLQDLCVERSYRGQGVARTTLQNLAAALAAEGKKAVRVRCMGEMNQVTEIYELLLSAGFVPCLLTGRLLSWQMMDWMDSPLAEQIKEIPTDHICDAKALTEKMREALVSRAGDFDPELSRFYIVEEKLAGAVYVKRVNEHAVIAYRTYLAENVPFRKVYVSLLTSLLQQLRRVLDEDDVVSAISSSSQEEHALRKLFDEPDDESFVQEYVRRLADREPEILGRVFGQHRDTAQEKENECLTFGWLTDHAELSDPPEQADFSGAWALYAQEEPELEACLQQKEFLYPCRKVTDEPSLRAELNEWLPLVRRDPLPPEKELPFAAFEEQLIMDARAEAESRKRLQPEDEDQEAPVCVEKLCYFVFPTDASGHALLERMLPDFLLRNRKEHIVLGVKDEKDVIYGYASFYRQPSPQKTLMLEYLFVSEKYRGRGIASRLLRFAKEVFSGADMRGITTKYAGGGEKLLRTHEFFLRRGFTPITLSARIAIYYLQDLRESRLMEMTPEQKRQLPKVEPITNREDFRLIEFTKECREHGFVFDRSRYDADFTRFYLEGQRIRGVISLEQSTGNLLLMLDTYIARDCRSQYVQPALLLAAINEAKKRLREDAMLILQLYDGWNMQALETLLGQGDSSLRLCEYVMPFR
ncbi:MAG: GNAT family N-acetyltransferase [bacterium]|nr:GNAT family N-acetyltransferase [bacterium]MDY4100528.1 GNAT family N-acetyltransferase [Lachnospiraceae bacterium]